MDGDQRGAVNPPIEREAHLLPSLRFVCRKLNPVGGLFPAGSSRRSPARGEEIGPEGQIQGLHTDRSPRRTPHPRRGWF